MILEQLDEARDLASAAYMACSAMKEEQQQSAMKTLILEVEVRLAQTSRDLSVLRGQST